MNDVVIVGAGLAGLACAQDLTRAGLECRILEASDGVGGRVRTDSIDGFLFDRGFQILLTAYPQVRQRLDVDALELGLFEPGAVVHTRSGFHRVSDWEHLRTDVIPHGQPAQGPPLHPKQRVALGDGVFVCGDHRDTASIQGAMFSGERTASAVLHHLSAQPDRSQQPQPRLDGETSWR